MSPGQLPEKVYLGDAVYAEVMDWGDIVLTTEDGNNHRIVLEPQIVHAFELYLGRVKEAFRQEDDPK